MNCIYKGAKAGTIDKQDCFICSHVTQSRQPVCVEQPTNIKLLKKHNGKFHALKEVKNCSTCKLKESDWRVFETPENEPIPKDYFRYITTAQLCQDTLKLIPEVPHDCKGIVGVPRSGMIVGGILATNLHLPLYELTEEGPRLLSSGYRGTWLKFHPGDGPFFVVDDSTHNGQSIEKARAKMKGHNAIFATVYSRAIGCADVSAVPLDVHIFEWNLFNNKLLQNPEGGAIDKKLRGGFCFDFDGVLCEDTPFKHTDENEKAVIAWILNAKPKHLVRGVTIPTVISFRLEKHREHILKWCDKWGVKINNLILHPANTFKERDNNFNVVQHKAERFKNSQHCIMVESCKIQAKLIAKHANKPVIATDTGEVFWGE